MAHKTRFVTCVGMQFADKRLLLRWGVWPPQQSLVFPWDSMSNNNSSAAHTGLQVPPMPNPEGVLQHDVRSTDTTMDTAPVAYPSATTLSTPIHPMTIVKPRWGLGSDLTRTQGAMRDPGLRCCTPLAWWMQAHFHERHAVTTTF
jgi:hypothetical protein